MTKPKFRIIKKINTYNKREQFYIQRRRYRIWMNIGEKFDTGKTSSLNHYTTTKEWAIMYYDSFETADAYVRNQLHEWQKALASRNTKHTIVKTY